LDLQTSQRTQEYLCTWCVRCSKQRHHRMCRSFLIFFLNPLLFASCTNTFSKCCEITTTTDMKNIGNGYLTFHSSWICMNMNENSDNMSRWGLEQPWPEWGEKSGFSSPLLFSSPSTFILNKVRKNNCHLFGNVISRPFFIEK
jgi:hypothetical protein